MNVMWFLESLKLKAFHVLKSRKRRDFMTKRELKRLGRADLLEMLLWQSREIE